MKDLRVAIEIDIKVMASKFIHICTVLFCLAKEERAK